jgi:hypothetical protein
MLKTILQLLGADYEQWRALTRVAIKLDLRSASLGQHYNRESGESKNAVGQIISRVAIYVLIGAILAAMVGMNKDVFFTGTILVTYIMVMVAMLILVDFAAIVISPDDYAILGYQPVSSRTYFISRLTNVLLYTTLLSLALGIIPALTFFFTLGFNPLLGIAALLAVLLCSMSTALFLVFVYAGILRVIHPAKLKRVVGYIQLALSFFFYGGYMLLPQMIGTSQFGSIALAKRTWMILFPPTWFACYLDLARGRRHLTETIPALLSILVLVTLFVRIRGKLALDYADRLSAAMAVGEGPKKASKSTSSQGWFFRKGESRAVSLLVRNQFKYDQKFRLAVLSILPLTVIYLFMGLRKGPVADPFVNSGVGFGDFWLLYFAILMFPIMLNMTLANSDSYQASWIYYATPADRGRLVLASKNFVFAFFVTPYLTFLAALFFYFWRNALHVVLHLGVLLLLSYFALQLSVLFNPVLPFSMPTRKAQRSASMILLMMLVPIAAIAVMSIFGRYIYPRPFLLAGSMGGLIIPSFLLEIALKRRVQHRTVSMEYQG